MRKKMYDPMNRYRKIVLQNPRSIPDKNSQQTRNRGKLPQLSKAFTQNLQQVSTHWWKTRCFPLRLEIGKYVTTHHFFFF